MIRSSVSRTYPSSPDWRALRRLWKSNDIEKTEQLSKLVIEQFETGSPRKVSQFLRLTQLLNFSITKSSYPCVSGMLCGGPLLTTSCISTALGEMRITLYRRFTISPSPATKMSSPCCRKIFLGSPGWLANPKNLSGMGGGGGTGGT